LAAKALVKPNRQEGKTMNDFLRNILKRLAEIFDPEILATAAADWFANLIVALITFAAFYLGWLLARIALNQLFKRSEIDETNQEFIKTIVKYTILLIGGVNALSSVGVDTAGLVASLGIAGITIGFAARDAFSNLISGVLIFVDRPFVIGDLIEVGGNYGRVDHITLRSTRIITPDGKMLAVPNTEMINKTVSSYTNFPHLRLDFDIGIGVNENIDRVRRVILGVLNGDDDILEAPAPVVFVTELNDYNVVLQLRAWIDQERTHVEKRAELYESLWEALNQAKVDMPFETLQLAPLDVKINGQAETE
jgi:small conductance mechanosensitive channel